MNNGYLEMLIFLGGAAHLGVLVASALVPFQLNWHEELAPLSKLHRQMHWTYGGYVVLSIVAFAAISMTSARALAEGSTLARSFCGYVAVFWGVRVALQGIFDAKERLTEWWLRLGYHALTGLFVALTVLYGWAALHPAG